MIKYTENDEEKEVLENKLNKFIEKTEKTFKKELMKMAV